MFNKLFIIFFSFSMFFLAFHPNDCFAQRLKRSGNNSVTQRQLPVNGTGNKTISGKNFNSGKTNRDFNDINKRNKDINNIKKDNSGIKNKDININKNNVIVNKNINVYHGYHYSGYHAYMYHPYTPFYWGPYWHPAGFFVATMFATAIMISIANQNYYYYEGVYYSPSGSGYVVVNAPPGATITVLPSDYTTVLVSSSTYYYYGGTFYLLSGGSYLVVEAPVGAVVNNLPEGAEEVEINGVKLLKYNGAFYQPVSLDGDDAYEVVQIQK